MPDILGTPATTKFLKQESHKLSHEFVAAGTIRKGALVKLSSTGTISELGSTDNEQLCIGYAMMAGVATDKITVVVRGYAIIEGSANANSQIAGPVSQGAYDSTNARFKFAAVAEASEGFIAATSGGAVTTAMGTQMPKTHTGWALDAGATALDKIWVLLKN